MPGTAAFAGCSIVYLALLRASCISIAAAWTLARGVKRESRGGLPFFVYILI